MNEHQPPELDPIPTADNDPELGKLKRNVKPTPQEQEQAKYERFLSSVRDYRSLSENKVKHQADEILKNGIHVPTRFGIDCQFLPGTLNILSGGSGHGKSTLAMNWLLEWIGNPKECDIDAVFLYVSYESHQVLITQKLIDIGQKMKGKLPFPVEPSEIFDHLFVASDVPLEDLPALIKAARTDKAIRWDNPEINDLTVIPVILVLDYSQIIRTDNPVICRASGYERMKLIALHLEQLARRENIILICLAQQNRQGEIRESQDLFFFSSTVINLFNHARTPGIDSATIEDAATRTKQIKDDQREPWKQHLDEVDGRQICSLQLSKNRYGSLDSHWKTYAFDGTLFEGWTTEADRQGGRSAIDQILSSGGNG